MNVPRKQLAAYRAKFEEEFEKKKVERENQIKRQQLMQKAREAQQQDGAPSSQAGPQPSSQGAQAPAIKSLELVQSEIEKELDR